MNLFGINIAKLISDNLGAGLLPATLTKATPGTRTTGAVTAGTNPTSTSFACRGIIDTQKVKGADGIKRGAVKILLLGQTIAGGTVAPEPGDRVTIEGRTYRIGQDAAIDRDPAGATFTFEAQAT